MLGANLGHELESRGGTAAQVTVLAGAAHRLLDNDAGAEVMVTMVIITYIPLL